MFPMGDWRYRQEETAEDFFFQGQRRTVCLSSGTVLMTRIPELSDQSFAF